MTSAAPAPGPSGQPLSPALWLWKSRLPVILVPVLTSLRQFSGEASFGVHVKESEWPLLEVALLFIISIGTGVAHLPFSVTWWLVLLAAFALQTKLLLGVATVLSMSVALVWYGIQVQYPHAIMALWGGAKGEKDYKVSMPKFCWRIWDLCVHGFPAMMVIWWFGPSVVSGKIVPGAVTLSALFAALPLNILWLWGVGLRLPGRESFSLWPGTVGFADSNVVYGVVPDLPPRAWQRMYSLHLAVCIVSIAALVLDREVFIVNAIWAIAGLTWCPFTLAWWFVFIVNLAYGDSMPLLRGMCCCSAAPVAIGWYGTQVLHPNIFIPLVKVWTVHPVERFGPRWLSLRLSAFSATVAFTIVVRLGDFCVHFASTMSALYFFRSSLSADIALATLPGNLVYFSAFALVSGARSLADTNWIYGVQPNIPDRTWRFIFTSHWFFCAGIYCACKAGEHFLIETPPL